MADQIAVCADIYLVAAVAVAIVELPDVVVVSQAVIVLRHAGTQVLAALDGAPSRVLPIQELVALAGTVVRSHRTHLLIAPQALAMEDGQIVMPLVIIMAAKAEVCLAIIQTV